MGRAGLVGRVVQELRAGWGWAGGAGLVGRVVHALREGSGGAGRGWAGLVGRVVQTLRAGRGSTARSGKRFGTCPHPTTQWSFRGSCSLSTPARAGGGKSRDPVREGLRKGQSCTTGAGARLSSC